ncbi:ComEA family DNA-binding protein [Arthrobacter sp. E918]|uniref:ComEA family DNA-binding protein n=2 Tax=Arthrobacter mobilis TaxID=2724944 RepID=A0A7X6HBI5_9MICC|nr:ComEA family DNA-binding protein [Arthrobacter mobilis]
MRFRIAAGAAVVAAGAALGTGIVRVAGADLERDVAQVVASVPLSAASATPSPPPVPGSERTDSLQEVEAAPPGTVQEAVPPDPRPKGSPAVLVVHVAGAVARPGVVRLPAGSRVFEAVAAAGGAAKGADQSALNLAAPVSDGQQIFLPSPEHAPPALQTDAGAGALPPAAGTPAAAGGQVNINTATAEELQSLPRIGPVLAQRIIDFRQQHGAFTRPEDLDAVPGIGPGLLEALLELVAV